MKDYFKEDEYWKEHINKALEEDLWINNYKDCLNGGLCLDLGCGNRSIFKMVYGKWL